MLFLDGKCRASYNTFPTQIMKNPIRTALFSLMAAIFTLLVVPTLNASAQEKPAEASAPVGKNYRFVHGNWFDGKRFKAKDFYCVGGVFADKEPKRVDETIDLGGGYVVPPFGEAHNHNVESVYTFAGIEKQYLTDGVFYVKNPNSIPRFTNEIRGKINRPDAIDVVFSNGGLTGKDGHPARVYEFLSKSVYQSSGITNYETEAYYFIDSKQDLETKWARIMADKPDFIKTYLYDSEYFEQRRDDTKFFGLKGMNPALLPLVVEKAHRQGLRVSTHVNTATDFHYAVVAGVDEINHLPARSAPDDGKLEPYVVSEADAKLAAKKHIVVVATYSLLLEVENQKLPIVEQTKNVQRQNLRMMQKYGIPITIGTDSYANTSQLEAIYLHDLGVFDNVTLLKMWAEATPKTIFPGRKIGLLKAGYEASFLLLGGNPLTDFAQVKNIKRRFKQGQPLELAATNSDKP